MATISPNDSAPRESVHYLFATGDFKLGGHSKKYETDDPALIAEAKAHPWLSVEVPEVDRVAGAYVEQVSPADDPMSRLNYHGNEPEVARAAEAAKVAAKENIVGIESGLDQNVPETVGPVAQTLAADPTSKTSDKVKD